MIGVTFQGRLGNQLFQFSFYRYVKSRSKGRIVFFPNPHHAYLTRYFDLGTYNLFLGSKIYSVFTRMIPRLIRFREVYIHNFVSPRHREFENYTIYHGYYQTDWYLEHTPVKFDLKIKPKYIAEFRQKFGEIFDKEKTVVVHIRRTDYLNYGKRNISIPILYFKERLSEIADLEKYKVIFLSDDMEYVRANIEAKPNFMFSHNNEIIDFQIIQHADIAIISNSSFSWWASYLGKKDNVVYAPENWLGFHIGKEHPRGVMTDRFIWKGLNKIDV
jgi:hypothetical protein